MKYLWLLVFIFSFGCAGYIEPPYTIKYTYTKVESNATDTKVINIYVDYAFTDKEKISIVEAIEQWNYVLNDYIRLNVVASINEIDGKDYAIIRTTSKDVMKLPNISEDTLAWADRIGTGHRIYVIVDRIDFTQFENVVIHEIGHLMGAKHKVNTTMNKWVDARSTCIDRNTVEQVATYQKILFYRLNFCIRQE